MLLKDKPIGYDKVGPQFKDPDGYFTGVVVLAFANVTATSAGAVYGGFAAASFPAFSGLQTAPTDRAKFTLPAHSPFVSWAQTAAILKKSPHPAAAKLYISWLLSSPVQSSGATWSPRTDIPLPPGYRSVLAYPNTDPTALARFLCNRAAVDRFPGTYPAVCG